ncbi:unnamed protein product [Colias eurytheme]|nr:unnamed protein product [Colias eurytheme]
MEWNPDTSGLKGFKNKAKRALKFEACTIGDRARTTARHHLKTIQWGCLESVTVYGVAITKLGANEKSSPARVEPMQSVRTTRGSRVKLECRASARPPPRISWYRDGRPVADIALRRFRVQSFRRRSVLVIRHARREDAATYECRAQGAVGPPAIASANVSVLPPATSAPDTSMIGAPCPMPDPSSYCLNGGTCLFFELVQEQACKCPEGFNGQRCENKDVSNRSSLGERLW